MEYKVLTLNIHKGFSTGNTRFTLEEIRLCLRKSQSNIVFLQEVIGEHDHFSESIDGWPDNNQFEFLADSVWEHFAYGKNAIYQQGHHGNAILSEVPFSHWNNVDLSTSRLSQRGVLHGQLENGLHLLCIHLGLLEKERSDQLDLLLDYIEDKIPNSAPLILAGDFNDWRCKAHKKLTGVCGLSEVHQLHKKTLAKTFPVYLPFLPMDRIYVRHFSVDHADVMTGTNWRSISDHCALTAELRLDQSICQIEAD